MLVTLLTKATTLKPDLPVFAPDFQARLSTTLPVKTSVSGTTQSASVAHTQIGPDAVLGASQPIKAAPTPAAVMVSATNTIVPGQTRVVEEEVVPAEHPPNYPRPGYGLMQTLPPEQEDPEYLVDDDDKSGTFTHLYR